MARFRSVDFYPFEGFPDRMWGASPEGPADPLADALLRAARPVVALYTEALEQVRVDGPRGSLSIAVTALLEPTDVRLLVWTKEPDYGPERAFATLCPAVGRLDARGRATLVLDLVDTAVHVLAEARGWDPEPFDVCHDHVIARDYVYTWDGPWKTSPDRRHQARARFRISTPDGFARAHLEVRGRRDAELLASSEEAVGFCTTRDLRSSAGTLVWSGPDDVGFFPHDRVAWADPAGRLSARLVKNEWTPTLPAAVPVHTPGDGLAEDADAPVPSVVVSPPTTEEIS